jgi:hypothetical protein
VFRAAHGISGVEARRARAIRAVQAGVVLIEDKVPGTQLIQELIVKGLYAVTRYQPQKRQGHAHARADGDDRERFRPPARHSIVARTLSARADDLSQRPARRPRRLDDANARLVQAQQAASSNSGIFELYRQRAEEARRQQAQREQPLRLRIPSGIGRMNLLHLNVAADGTVQMPGAEAESFFAGGVSAG